jgi:O-acetyl-ADP-ribose deacetylase (regulator of RNase III)
MIVQFGPCRLELAEGDITKQDVDAIVNAANSTLAGGGGVDGAIHRAAGPVLIQETRDSYPDGCPTGSAVVTSAGSLPAKFVFHAVGPVWRGGQRDENALLESTYRACLELAVRNDCQSIAFPAISTGAYGFPVDLAAQTSLEAARQFLVENEKPACVRFVLFDQGTYGAFARVLESMIE